MQNKLLIAGIAAILVTGSQAARASILASVPESAPYEADETGTSASGSIGDIGFDVSGGGSVAEGYSVDPLTGLLGVLGVELPSGEADAGSTDTTVDAVTFADVAGSGEIQTLSGPGSSVTLSASAAAATKGDATTTADGVPTKLFAADAKGAVATGEVSSVSAVPEPTVIGLAGIASLGLLTRRRRAGSR